MNTLHRQILDLPQLISRIHRALNDRQSLMIAIDGRCGAGKTTLAANLQKAFSATVIHADEFFLRPEQRTAERFAEPGGNMDRERLAEEVLIPLRRGLPFSYRPFDCSTLSLAEPVWVEPKQLIIVEGSYSCHPDLWDYFDLHIFADIDPQEQLRRITAREGAQKTEQFQSRWIPLEERYFKAFSVCEKCEIVFGLSPYNA